VPILSVPVGFRKATGEMIRGARFSLYERAAHEISIMHAHRSIAKSSSSSAARQPSYSLLKRKEVFVMLTEQIVIRYIDAWNELDPRRRRAAIEALYVEDCAYVDPAAAVRGRDALDGYIAGVQTQFPGMLFSLAGKIDAHHAQARFTWHAGSKGAPEPVVVGFDIVVLEGERICNVYGFVDKLPSEAHSGLTRPPRAGAPIAVTHGRTNGECHDNQRLSLPSKLRLGLSPFAALRVENRRTPTCSNVASLWKIGDPADSSPPRSAPC